MIIQFFVEPQLLTSGQSSKPLVKGTVSILTPFLFYRNKEQGRIVGAETSFTFFKCRKTKLRFFKVLRYEVKNTWFVFKIKYCAAVNILPHSTIVLYFFPMST